MQRKRVLVTGSTGGIGSAVVKSLDDTDHELIMICRSQERFNVLAKDFKYPPILIKSDLASHDEIRRLATALESEVPGFDLALLNAGIVEPGPVAEIAYEELENHVNINFLSTMMIIRSILPGMIRQGSGHIIVNVSMGGLVALKDYAPYAATKFGLRGFLWSLSNELIGTGVHVSGIYCSGVDTDMLRYEADHEYGSNLNFVGTVSSPDDVVKLVHKTIRNPRLERYLPYSDSISCRILAAHPKWLNRLYPLLERLGKKGRQKYLERDVLT